MFAKVGPKKGVSKVLARNFRTTGFQLKLLISIESLNIFHLKPAKNQSGCSLGAKLWPN